MRVNCIPGHYRLQWTAMNDPRLPPLTLTLRPARRFAVLLALAHAAVAGLLPVLPLGLAAALLPLLCASAAYNILQHALRRLRRSVASLQFRDREQLTVILRDGSHCEGRLLGSTTVGTLLSVLNIRRLDDGRLLHVVVTGDSLTPDEFRRLRVWLRWGPRPDAASAIE
jgi:hypothetical protein